MEFPEVDEEEPRRSRATESFRAISRMDWANVPHSNCFDATSVDRGNLDIGWGSPLVFNNMLSRNGNLLWRGLKNGCRAGGVGERVQ